jgi:hypothetical protein
VVPRSATTERLVIVQTPSEVLTVLAAFDARSDVFDLHEVEGALAKAVADKNLLSAEEQRGLWAERVAFALRGREVPGGGLWGTYFQPWMTRTKPDGTMSGVPDLGDADAEVVAYWAARARAAKHPVLVARYSDLVWDVTAFVTKGKRCRDKFEFVGLAIDAYIAASRMDDGSAWSDTRRNLARALQLAMSVKDQERTSAAVKANIEYVERTADNDKIGTYCYLFDNLLPPEKGPPLSAEQERDINAMFEARFAEMTAPGSGWDADPYGPRDVGRRLAAYYERKGRTDDRRRILRAVAGMFERRAKIGDALTGLAFLQEAREFYVAAGLREEAERVQLEAQALGPVAQKQLPRTTVTHEIPSADVERYLDAMVEGGLAKALPRFAVHFVPSQAEIAKRTKEMAEEYPLHGLIFGRSTKLGHGHIEADVGDETGDPDGKMVWETAQHVQIQGPWLGWTLERMVKEGLTGAHVVDFVRACPLFGEDRIPLVRQGVEAHFLGDYTQAIHLLVPQIEHALVRLLPHAGKPSNKAHRSGRAVMVFKSLNDLLTKEEWPFKDEVGENLRMYFLTALAHPKGVNIRNDVCHGLWSAGQFTEAASERVFHLLLTVALIRVEKKGAGDTKHSDAGPPEPPPESPVAE